VETQDRSDLLSGLEDRRRENLDNTLTVPPREGNLQPLDRFFSRAPVGTCQVTDLYRSAKHVLHRHFLAQTAPEQIGFLAPQHVFRGRIGEENTAFGIETENRLTQSGYQLIGKSVRMPKRFTVFPNGRALTLRGEPELEQVDQIRHPKDPQKVLISIENPQFSIAFGELTVNLHKKTKSLRIKVGKSRNIENQTTKGVAGSESADLFFQYGKCLPGKAAGKTQDGGIADGPAIDGETRRVHSIYPSKSNVLL
jgi:hypothetical protein